MTEAVPPAVRAEVARRLAVLEREEDVRVVYAVESGSRAWGFASTDSDFDVRFLYVHRPAWYLAIDRRRDVIERPIVDEIDLSGWDLDKSLGLMLKSNPPLFEWLRSPLVYSEQTGVAREMRRLGATAYDPKAGFHHYLHMAQSGFRGELQRDRVRHKKYFYVLRPALACRWIDAEATPPPMEFEALVDRFLPSGAVRDEIDRLLAAKRAGTEADDGPPLPAIQSFLADELDALARLAATQPKAPREVEPFNRLFRWALREVWPGDPFWTPPSATS